MSPDAMNENQQESLSAFIDGELAVDEARFLLRRMDHDVQLRATWARYHVIRDGMRGQTVPLASAGFAESVFASIGGKSAVSARRRWLQWSGGGVIAAGVAAMALMAVQPGSETAPVHEAPAHQVAAISKPVSQPLSAPTVPRWLSITPSAAQMAQPAAATFYSSGPSAGNVLDAGRLAPYMTIPGYPVTARRAGVLGSVGYPSLAVPQSSALPIRARAE